MNILSHLEMKLRYYQRLTIHQKGPLVRMPTSNGALLSRRNGLHRDVNQDPTIVWRVSFHCASQVSVLFNFVFAYFMVKYCRSIFRFGLVWYCKNKSK